MAIKKIMTKSELEKKNRRNQIIVGVILVGLMIMSTLGYSLLSGESEGSGGKITYKGVDFFNNGEWQTVIDGKSLSFLYSPLEVESVKVPAVSLGQFKNKPLYFDSDNTYLNYEISRNLQDYVTKIDYACLNESDCGDVNYPIKNCNSNIIFIRNSNSSSISTNASCVFIYGSEDVLLKEGDALLYQLLIA